MAEKVPASHLDLFQKKTFANFVTLMSDGKPQVALSIQDPSNPYRYLSIQGTVAEVTEEGACQHITSYQCVIREI